MKKIDCPDFILGEKVTQEQLDFFDKNGVIIFRNFIPQDKVELFISETERIEKQWIDEGKEKITPNLETYPLTWIRSTQIVGSPLEIQSITPGS